MAQVDRLGLDGDDDDDDDDDDGGWWSDFWDDVGSWFGSGNSDTGGSSQDWGVPSVASGGAAGTTQPNAGPAYVNATLYYNGSTGAATGSWQMVDFSPGADQDGMADFPLAQALFHGGGAPYLIGANTTVTYATVGYTVAITAAVAAPAIAATGTAISSASSGSGLLGPATGRIFWSGGIGAGITAANYAEEHGGMTLEMTPLGDWLNTLAPNSKLLWTAASRSFASGASGPVNAFQGDFLRFQSVWAEHEYPLLQKAGNPIHFFSTGRW